MVQGKTSCNFEQLQLEPHIFAAACNCPLLLFKGVPQKLQPLGSESVLALRKAFPDTDGTGQFLDLGGEAFYGYRSFVIYFLQAGFEFLPRGESRSGDAAVVFGDLNMDQSIADRLYGLPDILFLDGHVESVQQYFGTFVVDIVYETHHVLRGIDEVGLKAVQGL